MLSARARNPCATLMQRTSSAVSQFRQSFLISTLSSSSSSSSSSSLPNLSSLNHIRHFILASDETRGKKEPSSSPVSVDERETPSIDPDRYNQSYITSSRFYPDVRIGARWKLMRDNTSLLPSSSYPPALIHSFKSGVLLFLLEYFLCVFINFLRLMRRCSSVSRLFA